jgi:cell division protein FtsL
MDSQTDIGEVGNALLMASDEPQGVASVGPATKDPDRWRLRSVYLCAVLLLAVGTVVAVASHNQLARTQSDLATTRTDLHQTLGRLVVARRHLAATASGSNAAKATLDAESAALAADQKQLATAQANVYSNGVSIGNLDTCLSGVQKALNLISLGNQAGGAVALSDVATSCQSADPSGT